MPQEDEDVIIGMVEVPLRFKPTEEFTSVVKSGVVPNITFFAWLFVSDPVTDREQLSAGDTIMNIIRATLEAITDLRGD